MKFLDIFKNVDERFKEIGFTKVRDDKCRVVYERYNEISDYKHVISIVHDPTTGKNFTNSYDDTSSYDDIYKPSVGLTYREIRLVMLKMREKKWMTS